VNISFIDGMALLDLMPAVLSLLTVVLQIYSEKNVKGRPNKKKKPKN